MDLEPELRAFLDKQRAAADTDDGDNTGDLRSVLYARNVVHQVVRDLGYTYFLMLDDDYDAFRHLQKRRGASHFQIRDLNRAFEATVDYLDATQATSLAWAQGGDFIGGVEGSGFRDSLRRRKLMNTFFCSVDRPFKFVGKLNDDVNTYISLGARGELFFTFAEAWVNQQQTQAQGGGLTDIYLASGTYVKSFFTVMYAPSCTKIGMAGGDRGGEARIHHQISWRHAVPQIVSEDLRRT